MHRIKAARKEKKLTQVELANKSGVSRTYLGDVERNRYNPSVKMLNIIAAALDVPTATFISPEAAMREYANTAAGLALSELLKEEALEDTVNSEHFLTFIQLYDNLTEEQRKAVVTLMQNMRRDI